MASFCTSAPISETNIPETQQVAGRSFPYTVSPTDIEKSSVPELMQWVDANRDHLLGLVADHGALLMRGFDVGTPEQFAEVISSFQLVNMPYVGGAAARRNIVGDVVFTANESPPSEPIPFHHEVHECTFRLLHLQPC